MPGKKEKKRNKELKILFQGISKTSLTILTQNVSYNLYIVH